MKHSLISLLVAILTVELPETWVGSGSILAEHHSLGEDICTLVWISQPMKLQEKFQPLDLLRLHGGI